MERDPVRIRSGSDQPDPGIRFEPSNRIMGGTPGSENGSREPDRRGGGQHLKNLA
jgi:hypothetical protein